MGPATRAQSRHRLTRCSSTRGMPVRTELAFLLNLSPIIYNLKQIERTTRTAQNEFTYSNRDAYQLPMLWQILGHVVQRAALSIAPGCIRVAHEQSWVLFFARIIRPPGEFEHRHERNHSLFRHRRTRRLYRPSRLDLFCNRHHLLRNLLAFCPPTTCRRSLRCLRRLRRWSLRSD